MHVAIIISSQVLSNRNGYVEFSGNFLLDMKIIKKMCNDFFDETWNIHTKRNDPILLQNWLMV